MVSFLLEFYALVFLAYIVYSIIKEVEKESRIVPASLRGRRAGRSSQRSVRSVSISSGSSSSSEQSGATSTVSSTRSSECAVAGSTFAAPSIMSARPAKLDPAAEYRRCVRIPRLRNPGLQRYSRPAAAVYLDARSGPQGVRR